MRGRRSPPSGGVVVSRCARAAVRSSCCRSQQPPRPKIRGLTRKDFKNSAGKIGAIIVTAVTHFVLIQRAGRHGRDAFGTFASSAGYLGTNTATVPFVALPAVSV